MKQYVELIQDILENGKDSKDRTGTGTKFLLGKYMRFDLNEEFPLLTIKKTNFRSLAYEMLWFLGTHMDQKPYSELSMTNIKFLVDNGIHIWSDWPYKSYRDYWIKKGFSDKSLRSIPEEALKSCSESYIEENLSKKVNPIGVGYIIYSQKQFNRKIKNDLQFAKRWGNLGPVYGHQWRNWGGSYNAPNRSIITNTNKGIDQVKRAIQDLKEKPWDRGIKINAWNVKELEDMALRPCHYDMQLRGVPVEEVEEDEEYDYSLTLIVNIRSNDMGLGNPFNVAQYALLARMIAQVVNMKPGELIVNIGDAHIYKNHIEGMKEVVRRWNQDAHFQQPTLKINPNIKDINKFKFEDFTLEDYNYHPWIKLPVAV